MTRRSTSVWTRSFAATLQPRNTDLPQRHQRSYCRPRVVRRSYRSEVRPCVRVCLDAPKYPRPKGLVPLQRFYITAAVFTAVSLVTPYNEQIFAASPDAAEG